MDDGWPDSATGHSRKEERYMTTNKKLLNRLALAVLLTVAAGTNLPAQMPGSGWGQTVINGRLITDQQKAEFFLVYRGPLQPGTYWYDSASGFWGYWGHEVAGLLNQGHDFGPLPANASNGNTGVFINGRQLNWIEVQFFQQLLGVPLRGRIWLNGRTGFFGVEGQPQPVGNLTAILQARRGSGGPLLTEHDINEGFHNGGGTCTKSGNCYYPNR
jgi:hypothetical protein